MTRKSRILTGITSSGTPHIGNYIGAIKPAIDMAKSSDDQTCFFIADNHSLVKLWDSTLRRQYVYEIAASWLACGLDPNKSWFYRQSDVPEIMELHWILSCVAAKGLLNRAHAYKDQVAKNIAEKTKDPDAGITLGLYCYPVLMTADILMFNADIVPVGKDQLQHIEIARDIAGRFNHLYQPLFKLPEALVDRESQTIPGLDGRKMSKSYGNTIPLFVTAKKLRKLIMKIITNSQAPEEPKDPKGCTIMHIYRAFANAEEVKMLEVRYREGIGWGEAKQILFEKIDSVLTEPRQHYEALLADTATIDKVLKQGAEKAREFTRPFLKEIRQAVGL